MSYELRQEDIFAFAASRGAKTRQKGRELVFERCPYCNGGNHRDRDTFSINLEKGVYNCLRSSCGRRGHFVELCRDFDFPLQSVSSSRPWRRLPQPSAPPEMRESSLIFLATRGISRATAEKYSLTARKDQPNVLCFPFFDLQKRLVSIKYRNMNFRKGIDKCKEWFAKDTQPILFGLQCWNGSFDRAVITEGQLDSLSLSEVGIENAFSVPNGCSGFTWIPALSEWLNRFREITVFGDWENGRMTLLDPLMRRLKVPLRAVRQQDYLQEKDANDILRKYGPKALRTAVANAEVPKLDHVRDLASVTRVDLNRLEKIRTGFPEIDRAIGGLIMGQLILLTGERGQGKSTFLSQMIANALDQRDPQGFRYPIFVYSGELQDYLFRSWLDFQLAGSRNIVTDVSEYREDAGFLPETTAKRIAAWYRGRIWLYDEGILPDETENPCDLLLRTVEMAIRQYGCRLIALDNLMTALDSVSSQNDLYLSQSQFVGKLKRLAVQYNVCILLVAHPRKSVSGTRSGRSLANDDVSGTGDITNKADVVLSCGRKPDLENQCQVQILKNRLFGKLRAGDREIHLNYDPLSRRIFPREGGTVSYGWEKVQKEQAPQQTELPLDYVPVSVTDLPF